MNRAEKINILKAIAKGQKPITDLIPQPLKICISKTGTTFWRGSQPISKETTDEFIRLNPPRTINVTRA